MAIFKAVTRPNGTALGRKSPRRLEEYLKLETDERGRVLRDNHGDPIPRDAMITALNADADDFTFSCQEVFAEFNVNRSRDALQYKHYVQGFPPEDNEKMDRETCHRLGVELARTVWRDFPVLVVSHFDQENDGIYHWHNHFLVGNCNVRTGRKLCTSAASLQAQKRFVAAQADAHGLARRGLILEDGRILDSKAAERYATGEYQLAKRLKARTREMSPEEVRKHNTMTQKAELRLVIREAARKTDSFDAFRDYLKTVYDVDVKLTRGVISYRHPERKENENVRYSNGWIRGRSLGADYEKEAILNAIEKSIDRRTSAAGATITGGQAPGTQHAVGDGSGTGTDVEQLEKLYRGLFAGTKTDEDDAGRTSQTPDTDTGREDVGDNRNQNRGRGGEQV